MSNFMIEPPPFKTSRTIEPSDFGKQRLPRCRPKEFDQFRYAPGCTKFACHGPRREVHGFDTCAGDGGIVYVITPRPGSAAAQICS